MSGYYIGVGVRAKAISLSLLFRDESDANASANVEDGPAAVEERIYILFFASFFSCSFTLSNARIAHQLSDSATQRKGDIAMIDKTDRTNRHTTAPAASFVTKTKTPKLSKRKTISFYESKKKYTGQADEHSLEPNTFGYYINNHGRYIAFVTDDKGTEAKRQACKTQEDVEAVLVDWVQSYDFLAEREATIEDKAPIIRSYLEENYRFTRTKLSNYLAMLMSRRAVAFEMLYFIERGECVPDRFAVKRDGQTAKSLCRRGVAVPDAFARFCR